MISIKLMKNILLYISAVYVVSCQQINYREKITLNKDYVFWDSEIGYSWHLNKNGVALWYGYKDEQRYLSDFGDVIIDKIYWKINIDTIFFFADNAVSPTAMYQIMNVKNNILL